MAKKLTPADSGSNVRVSAYVAMKIADLRNATQAYWDDMDRKEGRECRDLTASDIIRTALGEWESRLLEKGILKPKAGQK